MRFKFEKRSHNDFAMFRFFEDTQQWVFYCMIYKDALDRNIFKFEFEIYET